MAVDVTSKYFQLKKWFRKKRQSIGNLYYIFSSNYARPGKENPAKIIEISLLCPTRARPSGLQRMWHSALATADKPDSIELVCYIDHDDCMALRGLRLAATKHAQQVYAVVGDRTSLSKSWNMTWQCARGNIFMMCADDVVFRSKGWDSIVKDTMDINKDNIAFVYGRDGVRNEELGTLSFVHKNWTNILNYYVPEVLYANGVDLWLHQLADSIKRRYYRPEIFIEHMHSDYNKSFKDGTYMERKEREKNINFEELWDETASLRLEDTKKLQEFIDTF